MLKPISCERIPRTNHEKLCSNGYNYVSDLKNSSSAWVRNVANDIDKKTPEFFVTSALNLYQSELSGSRIKTGCVALEECLDGGVPCGRIVEVCGAPAQGKTQLCLQLAICAQLPKLMGGLESEALYIDSAANFTACRLKEIAEYYENLLPDEHRSQWNSETALKKVHCIKVLGTAQFLAAMFLLEKLIEDNSKIRLIIIDNIATPFKDGCLEIDRIGILYRTMSLLNRIACEKQIAVVITNEVNLRLGLEESQVGALGDSWAHLTQRLLLAPPLLAMRHQCASSPIEIGRQGISDCSVRGR